MKTNIIITVLKIIAILFGIFLCIIFYKEIGNIITSYFLKALEYTGII